MSGRAAISRRGFLGGASTLGAAALLAACGRSATEQPATPPGPGFLQFQQSYTQNYALISAAGVIMLLPMLVLLLVLQRRFVAGLTATGLKG